MSYRNRRNEADIEISIINELHTSGVTKRNQMDERLRELETEYKQCLEDLHKVEQCVLSKIGQA